MEFMKNYIEPFECLQEIAYNAHAALTKLTLIAEKYPNWDLGELKVSLSTDLDAKTITVEDNGIGMTAQEAENYLGTIHQSGIQDFMNQIQSKGGRGRIVSGGGFGIYTAFRIAHRIDITSQSYQEKASSIHWSCNGEAMYSLEETGSRARGTRITLHLKEAFHSLLKEDSTSCVFQQILGFTPFSLYTNGEKKNIRPPWLFPQETPTRETLLSVYKHLFPQKKSFTHSFMISFDEPFPLRALFFVPHPEEAGEEAQGIECFYDGRKRSQFYWGLIPVFLHGLRGVVDLPTLHQMNTSYTELANSLRPRLAEEVGKVFQRLASEERPLWEEIHGSIEGMLVKGALRDLRFHHLAKSFLLFETGSGQRKTYEEYWKDNSSRYAYLVRDPQAFGMLISAYAELEYEALVVPTEEHLELILKWMAREKERSILFVETTLDAHLLEEIEDASIPSNFEIGEELKGVSILWKSLKCTSLPVIPLRLEGQLCLVLNLLCPLVKSLCGGGEKRAEAEKIIRLICAHLLVQQKKLMSSELGRFL